MVTDEIDVREGTDSRRDTMHRCACRVSSRMEKHCIRCALHFALRDRLQCPVLAPFELVLPMSCVTVRRLSCLCWPSDRHQHSSFESRAARLCQPALRRLTAPKTRIYHGNTVNSAYMLIADRRCQCEVYPLMLLISITTTPYRPYTSIILTTTIKDAPFRRAAVRTFAS